MRPGWAGTLLRRYTAADLAVLTPEEADRFVSAEGGDPQTDPALAWELLYRLEPELYDRMATAERLHPGVVRWLPRTSGTIVEVAAGTGRLTLQLLDRARELAATAHGNRARVTHGFFDDLPVASGFADMVVACSAVTPASGHGGDAGLAEMERLCRPGGCVAIVWPNNIDWLAAHHYQYASFAGPMTVDFASYHEAVQLAEIFYPQAIGEVRRRGSSRVPYEVLGVNPPRDVAFKVVA